MNSFVAVRCRYYKKEKALLALDHSRYKRNGVTRSQNVFNTLTHNNFGKFRNQYKSCEDGLKQCCVRYKEVTGKKTRSDFNMLFEHILVLSESKFSSLERSYRKAEVRHLLTIAIESYMDKVKDQFGFEPIGFDVHLDEGYKSSHTGRFKRNVHVHVQFFNYDFKEKIAPLKYLMKKGKNDDGTTKVLNENFSRFQDLAHSTFKQLGFKRGKSKNISKLEHQEKLDFVESQVNRQTNKLIGIRNTQETLSNSIEKQRQVLDVQMSRLDQLNRKITELRAEIKELSTILVEKSRVALAKLSRSLNIGRRINENSPRR